MSLRTAAVIGLIREKGSFYVVRYTRLGRSVHASSILYRGKSRAKAVSTLRSLARLKPPRGKGRTVHVDFGKVTRPERFVYLRAELFATKRGHKDVQTKGATFETRIGRVRMTKTANDPSWFDKFLKWRPNEEEKEDLEQRYYDRYIAAVGNRVIERSDSEYGIGDLLTSAYYHSQREKETVTIYIGDEHGTQPIGMFYPKRRVF